MQKILNKTIMLTIPLSITLTSFAHANPSQEAQAFAAQFKKEPLKPKLTVEDVLNKFIFTSWSCVFRLNFGLSRKSVTNLYHTQSLPVIQALFSNPASFSFLNAL